MAPLSSALCTAAWSLFTDRIVSSLSSPCGDCGRVLLLGVGEVPYSWSEADYVELSAPGDNLENGEQPQDGDVPALHQHLHHAPSDVPAQHGERAGITLSCPLIRRGSTWTARGSGRTLSWAFRMEAAPQYPWVGDT